MNPASKFLKLILILGVTACANRGVQEESAKTDVKTPVTLSEVELSSISETISMNATSAYLRKNEIRSNVDGYVEEVMAGIGDQVKTGSLLFRIKTKEAEALGQLAEKDTAFSVKGIVLIKAPASGIITSVSAHVNSYLNDGDPAATLADQKSFAFILHVPYELKKFTGTGTHCRILLPDSTEMEGTITGKLSEVDQASQTQSYIVTPRGNPILPENLVTLIRVNRKTSENAQLLPKSCVLSNETMEKFWVMKMLNDSIAIKVPVKRGISGNDRIEILNPVFHPGDRFISSGSYGLPDTAKVTISKQQHE